MNVGESFNITKWISRIKQKAKNYTGELIYIHPEGRYAVFDVGNYKLTVSQADIITGEIELRPEGRKTLIKSLKPKIEKEVSRLTKQGPKITREQLLEECKALGTDLEAARAIADKYGLSRLTISTYMNKWGIKKELKPQPAEETKVQDHQCEPAKEAISDNNQLPQHGMSDEFKLVRKGKFDKEKAVKIFYSVASLLDREEEGYFLIDLNVRQG